MLGGVAAVAGVASLGALAVGGVAWIVSHELVQGKLKEQRIQKLGQVDHDRRLIESVR